MTNRKPYRLCADRTWRHQLAVSFLATCLTLSSAKASDFESRGGQFIGITNFTDFEKSGTERDGAEVLTSAEITPRLAFDQLIASWNVDMAPDAFLKLEARAIYPQAATKYYTLALWSLDPAKHPRESVPGQKDSDGDVVTDTLVLDRLCQRLQVRLTLSPVQKLRFLGLCLVDTKANPPVLAPNHAAWGKTLDVPERTQMAYTNGAALCSPTTVSMLMGYWAKKLERAELDRDVPAIETGVYDPNWHGSGNWPFNMAYVGSNSGMRAYVARFSDISELEDWIASGIPVGLSVCYNRLRGKAGDPSGHLVVCVGFTSTGEVVINDPGTREHVRKTFPRANLIRAWAYSHNTVYLVYPEDATLPPDRFGHWESQRQK
jgi:hypothetical protein